MSIDVCPSPPAVATIEPDRAELTINTSIDGAHRMIHVAGELDRATRIRFFEACLDGAQVAVVVDIGEMTFLDCGGYGGLVAARLVLEQRGGSLTLRDRAGQPARLLSLFEAAS